MSCLILKIIYLELSSLIFSGLPTMLCMKSTVIIILTIFELKNFNCPCSSISFAWLSEISEYSRQIVNIILLTSKNDYQQ